MPGRGAASARPAGTSVRGAWRRSRALRGTVLARRLCLALFVLSIAAVLLEVGSGRFARDVCSDLAPLQEGFSIEGPRVDWTSYECRYVDVQGAPEGVVVVARSAPVFALIGFAATSIVALCVAEVLVRLRVVIRRTAAR